MTEYGAEANRDGPLEEKGTYQFQDDFVRFHLGVFASKPWLTGSVYWALQEFRVRAVLGRRQPVGHAAAAPEGARAARLDEEARLRRARATGTAKVRQYVTR